MLCHSKLDTVFLSGDIGTTTTEESVCRNIWTTPSEEHRALVFEPHQNREVCLRALWLYNNVKKSELLCAKCENTYGQIFTGFTHMLGNLENDLSRNEWEPCIHSALSSSNVSTLPPAGFNLTCFFFFFNFAYTLHTVFK